VRGEGGAELGGEPVIARSNGGPCHDCKARNGLDRHFGDALGILVPVIKGSIGRGLSVRQPDGDLVNIVPLAPGSAAFFSPLYVTTG
jgi:hypothetical protein